MKQEDKSNHLTIKIMKTTNENMHVYFHPKNEPPIGYGYYYTVSSGATPHTAFRTKKALKNWLITTGLKLGSRRGRIVNLSGVYYSNMEMLNTQEFIEKHAGKNFYYALCNGNYSIGFIEKNENGNVLHYQNPNTDRPILDYKKVTNFLEK